MNRKTDVDEVVRDGTIQGSYDECDGDSAFVIADVTRDDAWLSIASGEEIEVSDCR